MKDDRVRALAEDAARQVGAIWDIKPIEDAIRTALAEENAELEMRIEQIQQEKTKLIESRRMCGHHLAEERVISEGWRNAYSTAKNEALEIAATSFEASHEELWSPSIADRIRALKDPIEDNADRLTTERPY